MNNEKPRMSYNSRSADKFVVRLPDGMRERIADVARTHHRSMNSEIIARLARSIEEDEGRVVSVDTQETKKRTVSWCPEEGEAVVHDELGLGILRRMLVRQGKLCAEICFESRQDIYPLESGGPIRPHILEVSVPTHSE